MKTPETRPPRGATVKDTFLDLSIRDMLRMLHIPSAAHHRFVRIVLPVAPWVFGCAGAAYASCPSFCPSPLAMPPSLFPA